MNLTSSTDRSKRRRAGWVLPLAVVAALVATTGEAGAAGNADPTGTDRADTSVAAVQSVPAAQSVAAALSATSKRAGAHGAGQNGPRYSDGAARYTYRCVGEQARFKITSAKIVMWSRGQRIKGFHFKYRLVAQGTEGQPQWWSNWSDNVKTSFPQGRTKSFWMNAGGLGQSFSSLAAWDMEIKLKYPRSLRRAYRYKYRRHIASPQCGAAVA